MRSEASRQRETGILSTDATRALRQATSEPPKFQIRLLGNFEVRDADGQEVPLVARKASALVALLALKPGHAIIRDKLCGLLWPEVRDVQALHSLRQTLVSVRKALPNVIRTSARDLAIEPQRVDVDVAALEVQLGLGTLESLSVCAQLYRGELLDGMALREPPFELWLTLERERLRIATIRGLSRLVELHSQAGELAAASDACTKLLQLDPLREQSHRSLMRLQLRTGERGRAIAQYRKLAHLLRVELGAEPDIETTQLYAELARASEHAAPTTAARPPLALEGAVSRAVGPEAGAAPCIPRQAELNALRSVRSSSLAGRANVCIVSGEAGVGKTHLCDQLARELTEGAGKVLRARCFESEQVLPFALWSNLLGSVALAQDPALMAAVPEGVRAELARLQPELGSAPGVQRAQEPELLFGALECLLVHSARTAPLTLILEDLHWADEMSVRALCYLARRCGAFWVATVRPEDVRTGAFLPVALAELESERRLERLQIEPFSRRQADELASDWANHLGLTVARDAWAEQVWSISEGNALVIVESARACAQEALESELERLPVPQRVRSLIRRRAQRLSQPARELLALAAVNGRELDLGIAHALFDKQQLLAAAEELVEHSLMRTRAELLTFTHDRIRETLYAEMLPARRKVLHAHVAAALERQSDVRSTAMLGNIGYHYSKAGDAGAAVRYLLCFAEQARRGHALGEALTALEQALRDTAQLPAPERAESRIQIANCMAFCLAFLGRSGELVVLLTKHADELELLARPALVAFYRFWWAFGLVVLGETEAAEQHARLSLECATACGDRRAIGFAHGILAYLCAMHGHWVEGVQHGTKSMELAVGESDMPEAPVLAAVNTHLNYLWLGDWQNALASARYAAANAERADSQRGRSLAACAEALVCVQLERWQPALDAAQRALETSTTPLTFVHALWVQARAQMGSGQIKPALAVLEHMCTQIELHDARSLLVLVTTTLAEAKLQDGDAIAAQQLAAKIMSDAATGPNPLMHGMVLRVVGLAELALGQLAAAREHMDAARSILERLGARIELARTRVCMADIELAHGERLAAVAQLRLAQALYRSCDVEGPLMRVSERITQLSGA
jgi:DNA-binding SARP family transcriptional activator